MEDVILKVENLSKQYRLGTVGTGTLGHDLNRAWHRIRGKEDPYIQVGAINDRAANNISDYVWALKDINFEIKRGEILGIIGKNGAGKSTLLKILSRVTSPTKGSVKTKGRIASLLEVGTGMHPELTGRENIFLNGAILGMTKAEIKDKIGEIVEFSGCQMYIDTPVKRYSSGMRVRLGFAVAAFLEPDILVVDEVLAVGDAEFQKKAIGKMKDISSGGERTVIFVSHNMTSIKNLCDRIIILDKGKVAFNTKNISQGIRNYLNEEKNNINRLLEDRIDREGKGAVKFCDVQIKNELGEIVNQVISGTEVNFFFKCENVVDFTGNLIVSMTICRENGELLSLFSNEFTDTIYNTRNLDKVFNVDCAIPNFPISEGVYDCNISLKLDGEMQDWITKAFSIKVVNGDFYGTGRINRSSHSGVLIKHNWS